MHPWGKTNLLIRDAPRKTPLGDGLWGRKDLFGQHCPSQHSQHFVPLLPGAKPRPKCPSGMLRALFAFFPQLHIHLLSL